MLLKRIHKKGEQGKFGLAWFSRNSGASAASMLNIIGAALAMHILALAVPIFFQIVIDRVLVYLAISTLTVIGIGVIAAILFDALFNALRSYFVLTAASRIDIRLAQVTFRHPMRLPISFFDQARTGVVTKHMQQGQQIREFLTGRLLGTLLDLPALFVFLPLLLWYSVKLTLVVLGVTAVLGLSDCRHAGTAIAAACAISMKPKRNRQSHAGGKRARHAHHQVAQSGIARARKNGTMPPPTAINTYVKVGKISLAANTFSTFMEKAPQCRHRWWSAPSWCSMASLTVGGLVAFNMLAARVISPVLQMIGLLNSYQETRMAVDMLGEVMNRPHRAIAAIAA